MLTDGRWHYAWDGENRLLSMETIGHQTGDPTAIWNSGVPLIHIDFKYDYKGRRISKMISTWNGSAFAETSETRFAYCYWNMVADYTVSGSTLTLAHTYLWGTDLSGNLHGASGVGGLLAFGTASGLIELPVFDGNGNVMGLTDRTSGQVTAAYEYSPFGDTLRKVGSYASINPVRFSSKYTDDETKLIYYGKRYYSSALGRFLGRDPIGEKGGLHLYAFTGNSPVNRYDFRGLVGAGTNILNNYYTGPSTNPLSNPNLPYWLKMMLYQMGGAGAGNGSFLIGMGVGQGPDLNAEDPQLVSPSGNQSQNSQSTQTTSSSSQTTSSTGFDQTITAPQISGGIITGGTGDTGSSDTTTQDGSGMSFTDMVNAGMSLPQGFDGSASSAPPTSPDSASQNNGLYTYDQIQTQYGNGPVRYLDGLGIPNVPASGSVSIAGVTPNNYANVSSPSDAATAALSMTSASGPASLTILSGHGLPSEFQGTGSNAGQTIAGNALSMGGGSASDVFSYNNMASMSSTVAPNGAVVIISCAAGNSTPYPTSLAAGIGDGGTVFAPVVDVDVNTQVVEVDNPDGSATYFVTITSVVGSTGTSMAGNPAVFRKFTYPIHP